jgi:cell wall-associated NlpC family hydrolase
MRRNWLAGAAVTAVAVAAPVAVAGPVFAGPVFAGTARAAALGGQQPATAASPAKPPKKAAKKTPLTWNAVAAALAETLVGDPYANGGTSPAGFDCSGLTQFVYRHAGSGKRIDRDAEDQFRQFRRISQASARPGDLVFFHVTSSPDSLVYHVGVYEGGGDMVAAATYGQGVVLQSFAWGGDTVTFGTITH